MSEIAKLSKTFKIAIPEEVRNAHGWTIGQEFVFLPKDDGVFIMPVPDRDTLEGLAKGADTQNYRDRSDGTPCSSSIRQLGSSG